MTPRRWQLVFATGDPTRSARFWCRALGYVPQPPPGGFTSWDAYALSNGIDLRHGADIDAAVDPGGHGPRLVFVRDDPARRGPISIEILTGEPGTTPTRAVLDVRCTELVRAGAHLVSTDRHEAHPWAQFTSPDDHPFRLQ